MAIREIIETIQAIRGDYENGNITGCEMSEYLEDLVTDIKDKNDHSQIFDNDDGYYVAVSNATTGLELALQLVNGKKKFKDTD